MRSESIQSVAVCVCLYFDMAKVKDENVILSFFLCACAYV